MKKTNLILGIVAAAFLTFGFINQSSEKEAKAPAQKKEAAKPDQNIKTGINIGEKAPEIAYNSPDGKSVSLASLKGKMVLIDFWASWCRPCRIENPAVVSAYNKYKDKKYQNGNGFVVLGVSLDMNRQAWIDAIQMDKLTWPHMSDLGGWSSAPARLYQVTGIPANFLIDGSGKIVAKNLRGTMLDAELEKNLAK